MNYRDFLQKVIYVIINPIIKMMIKLHMEIGGSDINP